MKIIHVEWLNLNIMLGIVVVENESTGKRRAYIGFGAGTDPKADAEWIKRYGQLIMPCQFRNVLDILEGK